MISIYNLTVIIFNYPIQDAMATTTTTTTTTTTATPATTTSTLSEVNRKQAFDGWIQEVAFEASKQYKDLELFLDELT